MIEVTNEENREEHERLLDEFEDKSARLDCLLFYHSSKRSSLLDEHDEQERRIRDLGDEWLKLHEQICELYRIYGASAREDNFRSDFKIVFEKAISDVNDDYLDAIFS